MKDVASLSGMVVLIAFGVTLIALAAASFKEGQNIVGLCCIIATIVAAFYVVRLMQKPYRKQHKEIATL